MDGRSKVVGRRNVESSKCGEPGESRASPEELLYSPSSLYYGEWVLDEELNPSLNKGGSYIVGRVVAPRKDCYCKGCIVGMNFDLDLNSMSFHKQYI